MKNRSLIILLAIALVLSLATPVLAANAEWTIMVYLCGTDLETGGTATNPDGGEATKNLESMKSVGSTDKVNVLVMTGGTKTWKNSYVSNKNNQIWYAEAGKLKLLKSNPPDSLAKADTLSGFADFAITNYPAKKYAVILNDHGGGPIWGFGPDQLQPSGEGSMPLWAIRQAISDIYTKANKKIALVAFDTCLLANLETGNAIEPYAEYMCGSSETGYRWDYARWMNKINASPTASGKELGEYMAEAYVGYYKDEVANGNITQSWYDGKITISVLNLEKIKPLKELCETLAGKLNQAASNDTEFVKLLKIRNSSQSFGENADPAAAFDLMDIGDFSKKIKSSDPSFADSMEKAIAQAVVYNSSGKYLKSSGITLYMPSDVAKKAQDSTQYPTVCKDNEFSLNYGAAVAQFAEKIRSSKLSVNTGGLKIGEAAVTAKTSISAKVDSEDINNVYNAALVVAVPWEGDRNNRLIIDMQSEGLKYDVTTGEFTGNVKPYWHALNGQYINLIPVDNFDPETDSESYLVPVVYEGRKTEMIIEKDAGGWHVIGLQGTIDTETHMPDRSLQDLKPGSTVVPLLEVYDPSTRETRTIEGQAVTINGGEIELTKMPFSGNTYYFALEIWDALDQSHFTDFVEYKTDSLAANGDNPAGNDNNQESNSNFESF